MKGMRAGPGSGSNPAFGDQPRPANWVHLGCRIAGNFLAFSQNLPSKTFYFSAISNGSYYESEGREFESLRAHHKINHLQACKGRTSPKNEGPSQRSTRRFLPDSMATGEQKIPISRNSN